MGPRVQQVHGVIMIYFEPLFFEARTAVPWRLTLALLAMLYGREIKARCRPKSLQPPLTSVLITPLRLSQATHDV